MLQAIKFNKGNLEILDQLQLPFVEEYIPIRTTEDGWHAIKDMKVRGAPAIAIVAMLALASELTAALDSDKLSQSPEEVCQYITEKLAYLVTSRPTAVNLADAARKLEAVVTDRTKAPGSTGHEVATAFIQAAEDMMGKDLEDNKRIGHHGAEWIAVHAARGDSEVAVLTHCNTG
jgi:methylthioribose-1-phosphate isomerase